MDLLNDLNVLGDLESEVDSGESDSLPTRLNALYPADYFDGLMQGISEPESVDLGAPAYRLMPSPRAANDVLGEFCPDYYFNGLGRERTEALVSKLSPIDELGELAFLHVMREWLTKQHGINFSSDQIRPEWVVMGGKVFRGVRELMQIYIERDPGRKFGAITPTYPAFVTAADKDFVSLPMIDDGNQWIFDLSKFEADLVEGNVGVLFLCNPNNPNGYVFSKEELEQIVRICKKHRIKIISDEVWADFVTSSSKVHTPIINAAQVVDYLEGVSMVYGTGKSFNVSGFFLVVFRLFLMKRQD